MWPRGSLTACGRLVCWRTASISGEIMPPLVQNRRSRIASDALLIDTRVNACALLIISWWAWLLVQDARRAQQLCCGDGGCNKCPVSMLRCWHRIACENTHRLANHIFWNSRRSCIQPIKRIPTVTSCSHPFRQGVTNQKWIAGSGIVLGPSAASGLDAGRKRSSGQK